MTSSVTPSGATICCRAGDRNIQYAERGASHAAIGLNAGGAKAMMLGLVALLGMAMGAMPADGPVKKYDGGWDLYKNDDIFALLRCYAGDSILRVAY